jgi:hypothetical protein
MKTPPVSSLYNRPADRNAGSDHAGLFRIGRIIDAVTATSSRDNQVTLRIGNRDVVAFTDIALPKNRRLSFRVMQVVPNVVLKYVPSTDVTASRNPLRNAMLTLLPRQSGLSTLLGTLTSSFTPASSADDMPALRPMVNALINGIPDRQDLLRADNLRQAMMRSGLFLEAGMAGTGNNPPDPSADLKALLLRLLHGLEKSLPDSGAITHTRDGTEFQPQEMELAPPHKQLAAGQPRVSLNAAALSDAVTTPDIATLYKKTLGALSRLVLHQIVSAEGSDDGLLIWQMELPVRQNDDVDIVSISIEHRHTGPDQDEVRPWIINLALDLPHLGPISIRTSLYPQGVSSTFWCEHPKVLKLIENQLTRLKTRFEELGMTVLNFRCVTGTQPPRTQVDTASALVDQHI